MDHLPSVDHLHSSANSNVLKNAASPEVLEAALEAAERQKKDDDAEAKDASKRRVPISHPAREDSRERAQAQAAPPRQIAQQPSNSAPPAFQAATALAEAGHDAVAAWLEFAQNTARTNIEALSRLAACRSWGEAMHVQNSILQERLQHSADFGQAMARASTLAVCKAADAMHAPQRHAIGR